MSLKNNLKILRVKAMMPITMMYINDNTYIQDCRKEHEAIIYYIIDHYSKDDFISYDDLFYIIVNFKNYVAKNRGYDSFYLNFLCLDGDIIDKKDVYFKEYKGYLSPANIEALDLCIRRYKLYKICTFPYRFIKKWFYKFKRVIYKGNNK